MICSGPEHPRLNVLRDLPQSASDDAEGYPGGHTTKENQNAQEDTMSVSVEKLEKSMAKLTITVSAEDFTKALDKA